MSDDSPKVFGIYVQLSLHMMEYPEQEITFFGNAFLSVDSIQKCTDKIDEISVRGGLPLNISDRMIRNSAEIETLLIHWYQQLSRLTSRQWRREWYKITYDEDWRRHLLQKLNCSSVVNILYRPIRTSERSSYHHHASITICWWRLHVLYVYRLFTQFSIVVLSVLFPSWLRFSNDDYIIIHAFARRRRSEVKIEMSSKWHDNISHTSHGRRWYFIFRFVTDKRKFWQYDE